MRKDKGQYLSNTHQGNVYEISKKTSNKAKAKHILYKKYIYKNINLLKKK